MKKFFLATLLLMLASSSFSQSFMHGAGLSVVGSTTGQGSNSDIGFGEGFYYFPRFNFVETEALSVSVGVPLVLGISATTGSSSYYDQYGNYYYNDNSSVGFMINAPLIVNLNMGRGSTKDNTKKFGYFVGAGFGYHHGDFLVDATDVYGYSYVKSTSSNVYGPAANAGVRFGVGRKHRNIEVRLSYMKGINENKPHIFGLAGGFNF